MKSSTDILGATIRRPQTPKVELLMQELIYDAMKVLMEESYLYRSCRIDIAPILSQADKQWSGESLETEFQHRPWVPWSQDQGDLYLTKRLTRSSAGSDPLVLPQEQRSLTFIIPTVKTWCYECEQVTVHDSLPHDERSPHHSAVAEPLGTQNFLFNMKCHECKSPPTIFVVRRELLKVQMCGRSHPFLPQPPNEVPKAVRGIYRDAVGAAACGDVFGAFYHLRTLLEHQMKTELGIAIADKIDGDTLCDRYNQKIDSVLRDRCSLKLAFDNCSSHLHNRTGLLADYEKIMETICDHFQLKQTLQKLNPPSK